ncbi:hypothetical protein ACWIGF_27850 [Streptomyces diastaticus]
MSLASIRPAAELPGDPSRLHFFYSHGHPAQPWDYEDTLECWRVQVTYGLSTDDEWDDELAEDADGDGAPAASAPEPGSEIGEIILYRLRTYTGNNRWAVADAHSGDLETIASAVLADNGHDYNDAFDETIESFGDLLILDRVRLDKTWRGFGLGPYCAAEAIRRLSGGCCAVAAYPGMSEYPDNRDEATEAYRDEATRKITALWETIGFHRFQHGVWLLDTALMEPGERLEERRADLEALSAAYQTHRLASADTSPDPVPATAAQATPPAAAPHPAPDPATRQDTPAPADGLSGAATLTDLRVSCTGTGWSSNDRTIAMAAAERATSDTDLRELAAQIKGVHFGLHTAWTDAVTFPARRFTARPFLDDPAALGPLADVWVYGSNLTGRGRGRSHGVGDVCQHARPLGKYTERMTLGELVSLGSFWEWNGTACSFCGGWSGQRLTHAQHAHYLGVTAEHRR